MPRRVADLATRFEQLVDRSGEHHVWLGSVNPDRGTGRIKVNGADVTAHRVAWELVHGALPPKARVLTCPDNPSCVRVDHLRVEGATDVISSPRPRSRKGTGSMRQIRKGTWELRVTVGRWDDGRPRTLYRSVAAGNEKEAAAQLVAFVDEMSDTQLPKSQDIRDLTLDEAMERFLVEHLAQEKGRAEKTVTDYRYLHQRWFSPAIGAKPVKAIDSAVMDNLFGKMRKAGLSASRLNQAKSLYAPFLPVGQATGDDPPQPDGGIRDANQHISIL